MPQGIQVFNADGSLQFEFSDRVVRVLTVQSVGTANGSVSNSEITTSGTSAGIIKNDPGKRAPNVTVNNGSVAWDWTGVPSGQRDGSANLSILMY